MSYEYEIAQCVGHVEVFLHGKFLFSADTISEAQSEIEAIESQVCASVAQ